MAVEPDREEMLDELGRCFVRAALNRLLADPDGMTKNADVSGQERRRRKGRNGADNTPLPATETS